MVLVDTNIWSLAFRRRHDSLSLQEKELVEEWRRLARGLQATLIGPVQQEVLSGVRTLGDFAKLQWALSGFEDLTILQDDYDRAAAFFNTCQSRGVTGGDIDMLICAVAVRNAVPVFTTDADFTLYAEHLPIRLHTPETH